MLRLLHLVLPLVLPLLLAMAAPAPGAAQAAPARTPDALDRWVERHMAENQLPGIALAIVEKGRIVREGAYGFANLEHRVPTKPETVFQSGSVGKQFTAALILMLAEEGKLALDDPIVRWFPGAPESWRPITIRHLLNHTSGLQDYGPPTIDFQRDLTDDELVRAFFTLPFDFAPGTEWSYSNTGYALLGLIVNRVTGAHWGEMLERRVFEPLGMETARVISEADIVPNRASGYRLEKDELKNQEWVSPYFNATADGTLYVTVRDLAKWDAALYGTGLLSEASKRTMWTPAVLSDGTPTTYGLGWMISDGEGPRVVEHGGSWQGFKAHIARYVEDSVSVVVLVNAAQADPTWIAHNVAGLHRPKLAPASRKAVALSAEALRGLAGAYRTPTGDTLHIEPRGAGVVMIRGLRETEYLPYAPDSFFRQGGETTLRFRRDASGEVRWVRISSSPSGFTRAMRLPIRGAGAPPSTLIRGAIIVDGSGRPRRQGSVRVREGTIEAIGELQPEAGEVVVDATGLVIAPGFIDTHSHHDRDRDPTVPAAVTQGITTIVVGQDGGSRFPLAAWLDSLRAAPRAVNVASFVGHGTLRQRVMGDDLSRAATGTEIERMRGLLGTELAAGALGLSSGLEYAAGHESTTEEVIALAGEAAAVGARYASHVRSEDRHLDEGLDEAIHIGRVARLPTHVSHLKLARRGLWGQAPRILAKLDSARASGVALTAEVYPYTFWQSTIRVLLPEGDYADREEAEYALRELAAPEDIHLTRYDFLPEYVGKTLSEVARLRGTDPATALLDLIALSEVGDAQGDKGESIVARSMDERDIETIVRWPQANIVSDGCDCGHPRGWGAFPRALRLFVREGETLTLEQAIWKMTSLAAQNAGIRSRGLLRVGAPADLVLFDPATVADRATLENPRLPSAGIVGVWVNGRRVLDSGGVTGERPGVVITR